MLVEKEIKLKGFTTILKPDDAPSLGVYGPEGSGKTRFALTMPGNIAGVCFDKKSKRTCQQVWTGLGKSTKGRQLLVPEVPLVSPKLNIGLAKMLDLTKEQRAEREAKSREEYRKIMDRVFDLCIEIAECKEIHSVFVDTGTELFDYVLYSHFGRLEQINPRDRRGPNKDMIDLLTLFQGKNLCFIQRPKDVWGKVGQTKSGDPIEGPLGYTVPDGWKGAGSQLTAQIELINNKKFSTPEKKFRVRVYTCQPNPMLEGTDLGDEPHLISGGLINWDNVTEAFGL